MKKYCVLVNGDPPGFICERFGSYQQQYLDMLRGSDEQWDVFRTFEGDFPPCNSIPEYDGLVLTGSKFDAYKSIEWMEKLRDIIVAAHHRKQRLLGICFGAQIIATALEGRVAPSNAGMQIGAVECTLVGDDPLLRNLLNSSEAQYSINQIHQDEIQGLPSGARLLASSPTCPVEAFAIGQHILATQGHPEFSNEYIEFYLANAAEQGMFPQDKCREWAASLRKVQVDTPRWHEACKRFLKGEPGSVSH